MPEVLAVRAQKLADEAVKPNAMLQDISYCWEGLDKAALPVLGKLMTHENPDVAFAAARAGDSELSQSAATKRRAVTAAAASDTSQSSVSAR